MAQSTFHPTIAAAQLEIKQGSAHSPRRDHLNVRTCGYDKAGLPASTFSTTYLVRTCISDPQHQRVQKCKLRAVGRFLSYVEDQHHFIYLT